MPLRIQRADAAVTPHERRRILQSAYERGEAAGPLVGIGHLKDLNRRAEADDQVHMARGQTDVGSQREVAPAEARIVGDEDPQRCRRKTHGVARRRLRHAVLTCGRNSTQFAYRSVKSSRQIEERTEIREQRCSVVADIRRVIAVRKDHELRTQQSSKFARVFRTDHVAPL
jgi:hypothetical protein